MAKNKLFFLSLLLVVLFSAQVLSADIIPILVKPLTTANVTQPSTVFEYTFNLTTNVTCANVVLTKKVNITTNPLGEGFVEIDVSSVSGFPSYLCEYRDGTLRKTFNISSLFASDIRLTGNLSGIDSIIGADARSVRIGDAGATSQGLASNDDLFVTGKLEVDGTTYFDGSTYLAGTTTMSSHTFFTASTTIGGIMLRNILQTPDIPILMTGTVSNSWLMAEYDDSGIDFKHPLQSNPTLFIQSKDEDEIDEWIGFTYINSSNEGVISTGYGDLRLNATGEINASGNNITNVDVILGDGDAVQIGDAGVDNRVSANDDLYVSGALEVDGMAYFDNGFNAMANSNFGTAANVYFGTSSETRIQFNNAQSPSTLTWGLGTDSKSIIYSETLDLGTNFLHGAQADPTIFIQSNDQTNPSKWISMAYVNASQGALIATGNGSLMLNPYDDIVNMTDSNVTNVNMIDPAMLMIENTPSGGCGVGEVEYNATAICVCSVADEWHCARFDN